jgi:hypothetical protein
MIDHNEQDEAFGMQGENLKNNHEMFKSNQNKTTE